MTPTSVGIDVSSSPNISRKLYQDLRHDKPADLAGLVVDIGDDGRAFAMRQTRAFKLAVKYLGQLVPSFFWQYLDHLLEKLLKLIVLPVVHQATARNKYLAVDGRDAYGKIADLFGH